MASFGGVYDFFFSVIQVLDSNTVSGCSIKKASDLNSVCERVVGV